MEIRYTHTFPLWMGPVPRVCAPWTPEEEQVLVVDFKNGATLASQCAKHGRAEGGINSRLEQLLDGESHRRRGISQQERDALLSELKAMRQRLTAMSGDLAGLTSKVYDLAK